MTEDFLIQTHRNNIRAHLLSVGRKRAMRWVKARQPMAKELLYGGPKAKQSKMEPKSQEVEMERIVECPDTALVNK
jgi:hypothetical protein